MIRFFFLSFLDWPEDFIIFLWYIHLFVITESDMSADWSGWTERQSEKFICLVEWRAVDRHEMYLICDFSSTSFVCKQILHNYEPCMLFSFYKWLHVTNLLKYTLYVYGRTRYAKSMLLGDPWCNMKILRSNRYLDFHFYGSVWEFRLSVVRKLRLATAVLISDL